MLIISPLILYANVKTYNILSRYIGLHILYGNTDAYIMQLYDYSKLMSPRCHMFVPLDVLSNMHGRGCFGMFSLSCNWVDVLL